MRPVSRTHFVVIHHRIQHAACIGLVSQGDMRAINTLEHRPGGELTLIHGTSVSQAKYIFELAANMGMGRRIVDRSRKWPPFQHVCWSVLWYRYKTTINCSPDKGSVCEVLNDGTASENDHQMELSLFLSNIVSG